MGVELELELVDISDQCDGLSQTSDSLFRALPRRVEAKLPRQRSPLSQSLASLQSPLHPVIDRLPVLGTFWLCATNGDRLDQFASNRLSKRQRKCTLAC